METRTDNDLMRRLYRPYLALTRAVAGDEEDLDRRFDQIMDNVTQQQQPHPPRLRAVHNAPSGAGRRRIITRLAKSALAGTGVAVVATRLMANVLSLVVITVTTAVTVFAITAVGDHYVARHKRTADTERDTMAPKAVE